MSVGVGEGMSNKGIGIGQGGTAPSYEAGWATASLI